MYRKPVSTLRPHLYFPLRRLALCLDCEKCFELGAEACPACGSGTWITLARFLDGGHASAEFAGARSPHAA
jgi:RNA polymerase subunit RPABC4/transcription elongation factor Spt4